MIATLVRKELLANLLTFRLTVALVFTVVLSVLATVIGSLDYSRNVEAYEVELRNVRTSLDEATAFRQVNPEIVLPPQPLAIFARGVVGVAPHSYNISVDDYWRAPWPSAGNRDSWYMKALVQIDFVGVVTLLLSFLAVVLGFDGICGERERGTLKVLLTNPIPRAHVVLAKFLGGLISLAVPLTVAFIFCLLVVLANGDVSFSGEDWLRLGLLYGLTILFLAQVFALSLMVSAFVRDADTALIICLFAWLLAGVGYISALPSFSRYGIDEIPHQQFIDKNDQIWREFNSFMDEYDDKHPPPVQQWWMQGLSRNGILRFYPPQTYEWLERRQPIELNKRLENADTRHRTRYGTWDPLAQEAFAVDRFSVLSPFTNYQVLSYQVARTTLDDLFFIGRAAQQYRHTFIDYLRSVDAFGRRWFTDDPPDQEPMLPDVQNLTPEMLSPDSPYMLERVAWAEEQQALAEEDDGRQLDLSAMPRFGGAWQRSLGQSFGQMVSGLAVLLLTFGAALMATVQRFLRYNPS